MRTAGMRTSGTVVDCRVSQLPQRDRAVEQATGIGGRDQRCSRRYIELICLRPRATARPMRTQRLVSARPAPNPERSRGASLGSAPADQQSSARPPARERRLHRRSGSAASKVNVPPAISSAGRPGNQRDLRGSLRGARRLEPGKAIPKKQRPDLLTMMFSSRAAPLLAAHAANCPPCRRYAHRPVPHKS